MNLTSATQVDDQDVSRYAWSRLRRFRNIPEVEDRIIRLHSLGARQRVNAKKQAAQLRHCLIQAQEYFDAASAVTQATKPVLFYYCIMSSALAEVLMKQSGMSSLDRARDQNKHHGLTLRAQRLPKGHHTLNESAASLVAAPLIGASGERFGTFELWHRSSREMPLAGSVSRVLSGGGSSEGFNVILLASDRRLPLVAPGGLSLLECLRNLPGMAGTVALFGIQPNIVRGRIELTSHEKSGRTQFSLVIHPADAEVMEMLFDNFLFHRADALEHLVFREMPSGGIIEWSHTKGEASMRLRLPSGTMWTTDEIRFWPCDQPLNEFGFIYVALYIVGNYARYYPDLWIRDVEQSSPLALAVEELLAMAARRMPLLTLSELSRTYFVPAA